MSDIFSHLTCPYVKHALLKPSKCCTYSETKGCIADPVQLNFLSKKGSPPGIHKSECLALQDEIYATGIDTGVTYGDYLTGVLFPSLQGLAALQQGWPDASAGVTLGMLGAEIIQVKAKRKYYGEDLTSSK